MWRTSKKWRKGEKAGSRRANVTDFLRAFASMLGRLSEDWPLGNFVLNLFAPTAWAEKLAERPRGVLWVLWA